MTSEAPGDRPLPLAGVRILDCSRVFAGPVASMLLGDLGAEVWKLEPPAGDETRGWGPPWWGPPKERRSAYFASVNRNKRSLIVDLRTEAGHAVLDRLATRSDILLHNYQPSVARRLGVDAERLRERHPHLVLSTIGGFPGEALAERPAYDLVAQAMSGQMWVTGEPDGSPMKIGVALLDLLAGVQAAIGALAGLVARERGRAGPAAQASVTLVEASISGLTNVLSHYLASGEEPVRWGTAHADIVPYQVFAARDGHLVLAVGNDAQFARTLEVLGLAARAEWASNPDRLGHRAELVATLAGAIAERARDELVAALTRADVPAGPVHSVGEAVAFLRAIEPGWLVERDGMTLASAPLHFDGERLPVRLPPPRAGEHTDAILAEAGFSAEEIRALRAAEVVA